MKLISFNTSDGVKLGIKSDQGIINVEATAAKIGITVPLTIDRVIASGEEGIRQLKNLCLQEAVCLEEPSIEYAPAVQNPEKIICVGANYRAHVEEANLEIPEEPIYFPKYRNSLAAHGEEIIPPANTKQVDYEVEMAVIIGKQAKNIAEEDALQYVFGYAVGNDLSARDLQFRAIQWLYGKAIDQFAPIGPYLVTADEVADPQNLDIKCWVNGELRQSSNTKQMIFPVAQMISDLSKVMTLEPGDVILTGTPEGVILGMEEKNWLKAGDEVVCEIEGLGRLVNRLGS